MLILSDEFKLEIEKDNTKLYPLVIINPIRPGHNNPIYLSTNSVTKVIGVLDEPNPVTDDVNMYAHFAPLITTVQALSSSINITRYNYKISNAGIFITDREYEGKKFSTSTQNISKVPLQSLMINMRVLIYYTTDALTLEQSALVFDGKCSSYHQNELIIQLTIESSLSRNTDLHHPREPLLAQSDLFDEHVGAFSPIIHGPGHIDKLVYLYKQPSNEVHSGFFSSEYAESGELEYGLIPAVLSNDEYANLTYFRHSFFTDNNGIIFGVVTSASNGYDQTLYQEFLKYLSIEQFGSEEIIFEPEQTYTGINASGFLTVHGIDRVPLNLPATGYAITEADFSDHTAMSPEVGYKPTDDWHVNNRIKSAFAMDSYPGLVGSGPGFFANLWYYMESPDHFVVNDADIWWGEGTLEPGTGDYIYTDHWDKFASFTPDLVKHSLIEPSEDNYWSHTEVVKVSILGCILENGDPATSSTTGQLMLHYNKRENTEQEYLVVGRLQYDGDWILDDGVTILEGENLNLSQVSVETPIVFLFDTRELGWDLNNMYWPGSELQVAMSAGHFNHLSVCPFTQSA